MFLRGTAVYRGVPLKKVLKKACGGVLPECKHLEFIGADTYFKYVLLYNPNLFTHRLCDYIIQETRSLQLRRLSSLP